MQIFCREKTCLTISYGRVFYCACLGLGFGVWVLFWAPGPVGKGFLLVLFVCFVDGRQLDVLGKCQ